MLRPPHRGRGVRGEDLADDEPVAEHADRGQVLFHGRDRSRVRPDVGGHVERRDGVGGGRADRERQGQDGGRREARIPPQDPQDVVDVLQHVFEGGARRTLTKVARGGRLDTVIAGPLLRAGDGPR